MLLLHVPLNPDGTLTASSDEDEVRLLVPAHDDDIARSRAEGATGTGGVLAPDDHLAGLVGFDPVFRLVPQVGALMDGSRISCQPGDEAAAASLAGEPPSVRVGLPR